MFFFEKYLGRKLPKHAIRLFRRLEYMRQHCSARPIVVVERGDQGLRPLLEQYIAYRIEKYGHTGITVADHPPRIPAWMYKSEDHILRRRRISRGLETGDETYSMTQYPFQNFTSATSAETVRGLSPCFSMMLDVQDYKPYANPFYSHCHRFQKFYHALVPMMAGCGFCLIHVRIDRSMPWEILEDSHLWHLLNFCQSLEPPDAPPPRPVHRPPIPPGTVIYRPLIYLIDTGTDLELDGLDQLKEFLSRHSKEVPPRRP